MKQITIIIGLIVSMVISSMVLFTIETKSARKSELYRATSAAVKQTVRTSQIDGQKEISNDDSMVNYFTNTLLKSIQSEGDIEIEIMGVDYKEGMIDVIVTERYKYATGKEAEISVRKTAILE